MKVTVAKVNKEKIFFRNQGFKYLKEIDHYMLDGYGVWVFNIARKGSDDLEKVVAGSEYLSALVNDGCELVVGPSAPASNGCVYDEISAGIYVKNYLERIKRKQENTGRENVCFFEIDGDSKEAFRNDSSVEKMKNIDELVAKEEKDFSEKINMVVVTATRIANNLKTIKMHCGMGLNLGDIYEAAIDRVYAFERETADEYADDELYSIINVLEELGSDNTISHMVLTLRNILYERVVDKKEVKSSEEVACLVREASRLSDNYGHISTHTGLGYNLNKESDKVQGDIIGFVSKVFTEHSDDEIIGFISDFEKIYDGKSGMPKGASYILSSIKNDFQKKILDSKFKQDGKSPKEKK